MSWSRQATSLAHVLCPTIFNMHVLPIYANAYLWNGFYLLRAWHPQAGHYIYTPVGESPLIPVTLFRDVCCIASCSLKAFHWLPEEKLNHRMGTLFYKRCFIKTKRFYENLGRVEPCPSESLWKGGYSEGVRFLIKWFWEKGFDETPHCSSCRTEQLPRATTLPWNGTGLSP